MRHICESNSWKLNASNSMFTSVESLSFLKGWSSPCAERQRKVFLDCRCLQGESCRHLVFGLTWVQAAVQLQSHLQGSSHPIKSGRTESCEGCRWGPLSAAGQTGGCCPPCWLAVPPCPLHPLCPRTWGTQDLPHPVKFADCCKLQSACTVPKRTVREEILFKIWRW